MIKSVFSVTWIAFPDALPVIWKVQDTQSCLMINLFSLNYFFINTYHGHFP